MSPYIKPKHRERFDDLIDQITAEIRNEGEVNYVISTIIADILASSPYSYRNLNSMIGVLECAKLELYRRAVAPYEDLKINDNGDLPSYG